MMTDKEMLEALWDDLAQDENPGVDVGAWMENLLDNGLTVKEARAVVNRGHLTEKDRRKARRHWKECRNR